MRVAVIKSNEYIDKKINKILIFNEIKGDFITKFTINSLNKYDVVIFTYKNNIPNLPKVLESIVLEQKIFVLYINNIVAIGEFYNILDNLYFSIIDENNIETEVLSILNNSLKYIVEMNKYKIENEQLKDQLKSIKLVNKAKSILMIKGFSEVKAHKYIQKKAMDLRLSKLETANLIIENKIDI